MILFPAIDLYEKKAVRLLKGDYAQMTVYSEDPAAVAEGFVRLGATHIHIVDLEGARDGTSPNFETVCEIKKRSGVFCELGGGVRDMGTIERVLSAGLDRVILGTAAIRNRKLLEDAVAAYAGRIAVGVDIRDGKVSVNGWTESSGVDVFEFCGELEKIGVRTIICTDISRDGAMHGTNRELYKKLSKQFRMDLIASGGISSMEDIRELAGMGLCGAVIGKALYTGAVDLREALEVAG